MSWMFSGLYFVSNCAINILHHMLCYLPNIYNYITIMESLERVQFEFVQSFQGVQVLYFSDFELKRLLNSFDACMSLLSSDSRAGRGKQRKKKTVIPLLEKLE